MKCIISTSTNPFANTAFEDHLVKTLDVDHMLYLWHNEPCVIIGRHQNPWVECNVGMMKENGVHLVRRFSGGGAVYQDLGNINFSFISKSALYDKNKSFAIVLEALKSLGITAERSGRNDIVVDGKKISGNAFKETKDASYHHGTLLLGVQLDKLTSYLTPRQKKLESKGITSVRSRVCNISEHVDVDKQKMFTLLSHHFFDHHNFDTDVQRVDPINFVDTQHLQSKAWTFGETPSFSHHLHDRFSFGCLDIHLDVKDGIIVEAKVFSDALDVTLVPLLESALKGTSYAQLANVDIVHGEELRPFFAKSLQ